MPDTKGRFSLEEIKIGLEKYKNEFGHYPSAVETDECLYLPSVRQIQRRFGGLPNLKKDLGIEDVHYGRGKFRIEICTSRNKIGFKAERDLEKILVDRFGEPFVHIERPISKDGKRRFDFFVYARNIKFGVDVFYSETRRNIQINVNSKLTNYNDVEDLVYFVMANKDISQEILDSVVEAKPHKPFPKNIKLMTLDKFIEFICTIDPILY